MTIAEAAQKAGVNPMTVRRWIRGKKLQAEKKDVGGVETWIIDPEHLEAFLGGREGNPQPEEAVQHVQAPSEGAAVLAERVAGLEAMVELLKSQVEHKDGEIRALITTNARLADQNADLQARALPAPKSEVEPQGFWNRLFKKG